MTGKFDGRVAVVTGGGGGIGAAIARRLLAEGAKVLVADLDDERGQAIAEELGPSAAFRRVDVGDVDDVNGMIEAAMARFGAIDLLVNNAGIGGVPGTAPEISPADWDRTMAVNLNSVFYACRAAIPHMRNQGKGAIVNIASISGLGGDYGFNAYSASKGAVVNYTRTLAIDHARENIRVNAICPGLIARTNLTKDLLTIPGVTEKWLPLIPMGRGGEAEEIANAVTFLLSDEASYVTGCILPVDGGVTAHTGQPDIPALFAS